MLKTSGTCIERDEAKASGAFTGLLISGDSSTVKKAFWRADLSPRKQQMGVAVHAISRVKICSIKIAIVCSVENQRVAVLLADRDQCLMVDKPDRYHRSGQIMLGSNKGREISNRNLEQVEKPGSVGTSFNQRRLVILNILKRTAELH